ncbi:MAG: dNTP triphosphohydrolase [Marinilabiliaceae bacterium]|nr:dNTP triphosphohydrolase [Marinilabiliaceae bacterium]
MDWNKLLTTQRTGNPATHIRQERTEFKRDYDRLIFSATIRRMQNKTQVFPLPSASVFVHNRLTHSLEVSSVGYSIGDMVATRLKDAGVCSPYVGEIGTIVQSACLAHDMGNPPFGHSGERAISHYFTAGTGSELIAKSDLTIAQRSDLINFDGNANTFRLLSHTFAGRREGGFALTFPTVASIIKYPRASVDRKKFGYFQQDVETFVQVMETLGVPRLPDENGLPTYARYPLVYLVEAADDICYQMMDVEDACRLDIISAEQTNDMMCNFFDRVTDKQFFETRDKVFARVTDIHERVAFLRSMVIGRLVNRCADIFTNNIDAILAGQFKDSLIDYLPQTEKNAMDIVANFAAKHIYKHHSVAEIELSGFTIIGTLLHTFIEAMLNPDRYYSKLVRPFIPAQFAVADDAPLYDKLLAAVDIVSGMTDVYALDLFKKVKGTI